ncbi:MAG: GAF domain-containing protein, partial [Pseudolabrys sp.]
MKGQSANKPKARNAPTAQVATGDLQEQLNQRTRELEEALQQQTATSEVLSIIRRSPADAQPVFDAIVQSAARLCDAIFSVVYLLDGENLRIAATQNFTPEATSQIQKLRQLKWPDRSHLGGRAILDRTIIHVPDVLTDPEYSRDFALAGGWRAVLAVPLLRDGIPVGALTVGKAEPKPFSDRQIQLLNTFADQALIAIENVRLFETEQQRTRELSESLEQQTATSEVLKVISSSPGDLQPVFDAILANATDLCDARFASLRLSEGDQFRTVSLYNAPAALVEHWRSTPLVRPHPESALGRTALTKQVVQIDDVKKGAAYNKRDPLVVAGVDLGGYRTVLTAPMLKEDVLIGVISIYRQEVRPFTDKQIELVKNFAAQAVIAIENTRLLSELRESLQQQTATADVLKVISRSTFDLQTVLDTLTASATRLCQADKGAIFVKDRESYRLAAHFGFSSEEEPLAKQYAREQPLEAGRGSLVGRVVMDRRVVHIEDVLADDEYQASAYQKAFGFRSDLGVPLLREGAVVGVFALMRTEVNSFTNKEIELVSTFAAQAVIAIENTRLLSELRESLQQQTATADVLKVISRSTFNLPTVLDTLTESATRLCEADRGMIFQRDGDVYRFGANYGFSSEAEQYALKHPVWPNRGGAVGRVSLESRTIHIPDVLADSEYRLADYQKTLGYRTILAVPLLRGGEVIGVLSVTRDLVNPFTEKQIELVTTFADQAVIAIENVRLFDEVQARTRELAKSLEELRTTQDRLVQTQKLALLGQLTAGIAHEIKNPLNFINNFSGISAELIGELQDTLKGMPLDDKARTEIN